MGSKSRLLETLPNFLLFFLFSCCMFFVLLSGARLYKDVTNVMEKQFSVNTCVSYMTTKMRHYDTLGAVSVGKIGEQDALLLRETIDEEEYLTYLYCSEGNLMELFCSADMDVLPSDGQVIMPLDKLSFSMENNLLTFSCAVDGSESEAAVFLQSGKGDVL